MIFNKKHALGTYNSIFKFHCYVMHIEITAFTLALQKYFINHYNNYHP